METEKCPGCGVELPARLVADIKDKTEPESCPRVGNER